jgi:hypothetical protein
MGGGSDDPNAILLVTHRAAGDINTAMNLHNHPIGVSGEELRGTTKPQPERWQAMCLISAVHLVVVGAIHVCARRLIKELSRK